VGCKIFVGYLLPTFYVVTQYGDGKKFTALEYVEALVTILIYDDAKGDYS